MTNKRSLGVEGRRVLVVEDEYLIASDLSSWLEDQGAEVLGPVPSVDDALALLEEEPLPDAAVLDVNLGNEQVFPVADVLEAVHVPFVFLSGYDVRLMPGQHEDAPRSTKPLDRSHLLRLLSALLKD